MWQDLSEPWMYWNWCCCSAQGAWLRQREALGCLLLWVQVVRVTWRSTCSCSVPLPGPLHAPAWLHPSMGKWSTWEKQSTPILGIFLWLFSCSGVSNQEIGPTRCTVPDPFPESGQHQAPCSKGQGASQQPGGVCLAGEGRCSSVLLLGMCLCVYMCVNTLCNWGAQRLGQCFLGSKIQGSLPGHFWSKDKRERIWVKKGLLGLT